MSITNSIAVLPFLNIGSNTEYEYFSDGITEEIINGLSGIENLKVISRRSSFFFKGKNIPIKEIADQLGVNIILEGSVRIAHEMVRISTQLIQAQEDFHFWSHTWDRKLENIFAIQDEISLLIAEKIREQFGHFEIADHLVQPQTENLDVYSLALKARYYFNRWNPEDIEIAIQLYEQVLTLAPDHVESCIGLADAYGFMATTQFMPMESAWAKAAAYTQKAYALNPHHAGVHYQLANMAFFTDCDFAGAVNHTEKSLALKPSYPEAQQFRSFLYMLSGMMEEARNHLQLALGIDPLNQETLFYKAYFFYRNNQFNKALEQLENCLVVNPKNIPALVVKCYCLLMMDSLQEAHTFVQEIPNSIMNPDELLGIQSLIHIFQKDEKKFTPHLTKLQNSAQDPIAFQAHSYLFLAYVNLGLFDQAFDLLENVLRFKSSIFLLSYSDPLAKNIFDHRRYPEFHDRLYPKVNQINLQPKNKTALLDVGIAKQFSKKLLDFMADERPYLNPDLSLKLLADMVEIHPNQLSWLLN
ncbi:MAG: adenylate cyclase, partial [Saprospiraceae bacterium]|nr:adenylate cyclase [Saprospiraceae bacterium]